MVKEEKENLNIFLLLSREYICYTNEALLLIIHDEVVK